MTERRLLGEVRWDNRWPGTKTLRGGSYAKEGQTKHDNEARTSQFYILPPSWRAQSSEGAKVKTLENASRQMQLALRGLS